ncbi:MAG TPA: M20 family peptidase [Aquabacterium sp.]|uniref:M20 family peptidase n=1 Tax=Aquabacterium sp. TaxID=1872578 RepID=UPI002E35263B|nr:M20 family peptidase [Aquabacterium sp.]HEX5355059.1 M20 family peptidase [Aquabacterium sp.]
MSLSSMPAQRGRLLLRVALFMAATLLVLLAVMAWHTWRLSTTQTTVATRPGVAVDADAAARRLSAAVQQPTVWTPTDQHAQAFEALHRLLADSFPKAHAALQVQRFGKHALLYTWPGRDPKAQPIALLAHQDVVPVAPGTEKDWQEPPFSGALKDGFIWGRGAWDDKGNLMAIMEAVEMLLQSGFQPRQTVYLAFGADEEVGGEDGAHLIASWFQQQGVRLRFALDEGLLITHGMVPGVRKPVALIGVAEKGYLTVSLTAHGQPGHTSMPPMRSAIGLVSEAVARVETQQMPPHLTGLPRDMFEAVAPEMEGPTRWLLSNLWLTAPLVTRQLEKTPSTNAMLRTTTVATVFKAGERENVLPGVATALVNFRLLPGDRSEDVVQHVKQVVSGLNVEVGRQPQVTEASPVSSSQTPAYRLLAHTLRELQPEIVVAPGLLVGGTDSRHFAKVSDATFRFSPVHASQPDLARFHGTNERIGQDNYVGMIQFYERLLRNTDQF